MAVGSANSQIFEETIGILNQAVKEIDIAMRVLIPNQELGKGSSQSTSIAIISTAFQKIGK
jgi:phosphatidylserine/phosphatidylglycerophosphate/cardiolipin synthase-like enzyme